MINKICEGDAIQGRAYDGEIYEAGGSGTDKKTLFPIRDRHIPRNL